MFFRAIEEAAEQKQAKTDPTFVERLVASIINNIQVSIENIHIRYEDNVSAPGCPFAFGAC